MKAFLSSTYIDLIDHRRAATEALERLGHQVGRMEIFGARPEEPKVACLAEVEACDLFVGLYAHRYGYVPPGSDSSITEQEFDHAKKHNKPLFCFIVDEDHPWRPKMIDDEPPKSKLRDFKAKIGRGLVRESFTTPEDLALKIATSISRYLAEADPERMKTVSLTITFEREHFDQADQRVFRYGIAKFLDISEHDIRIESIEEGSVKVTFELPEQGAERLLTAYKSNDLELAKHLAPLVLVGLRREEKFDITIFGQPVIDHVINLQNPFRFGELMKICKMNPEGELVFKENSWIRTIEGEEPYFFGMPLIYPDGKESLRLIPGKKAVAAHLRRSVIAAPELVARLGKPIVNMGGDGPNVLQILNQVFGRLSIEFIGAYALMPGGAIDPTIRFVLEAVPPLLREASPQPPRNLEIAPIYDAVPVNIVVEGMRGDETGILKSPFTERIIEEPFIPKGKAIMVNTIYSRALAVNALCCAVEKGRFGVLRLSESLCNIREPFSNEEKEWIEDFLGSRNIDIDFRKINTLYDFILEKILPQGPALIIMDESEFDHILNPRYEDPSDFHPVTKQKRVRILEGQRVHLDSLLEGFQAIRNIQKNRKSRIYVTLGVYGSLCLDEYDIVHYSPATVVEGIPSKGKTAIGSTYSAMVVAGEYISRFHKKVEIPYIMSAAAAAADALFYSGFESVSPATIDEYLAKSITNYKDDAEKGNYHELGPLSKLKEKLKYLPLEGAPHIRLSDIQRKDWFTVMNPGGPRMIGHYSLQDKRVSYGVEFLTLHYANSTVR